MFVTKPDAITRIRTEYGQAHTFWDINFSALQLEYAGADEANGPVSISIEIDTASGEVSLNPGYAEGSPERAIETALFDEFLASIVEGLVDAVPADASEYKAFIEEANKDREARLEELENLSRLLNEHEVDRLEDDDFVPHELSERTHERIAEGIRKFNG